MGGTDKKLEEYLAIQQQQGKEEAFLVKMLPYRTCAMQLRSWLKEYREVLPKEEEHLFRSIFAYSPQEPPFMIITGTKGFRSIYEKIYDGELGEEEIFVKLPDLARGRVTCTYLSQVNFLREHLVRKYLVEIKGCKLRGDGEKDYVTIAKDDGYRSFHEYLEVPVRTLVFEGAILFELQLRTELQDTWATRTHVLRYKNRYLKTSPHVTVLEIDKKILEVSGTLYDVDCAFDDVRQDILKAVSE
jgi:ppGpp synthetase/RelA/SpoT-type nucleotidyltranferase